MGAFFRMARAIASRWRCPPESRTPRSPIGGLVALRQRRDELVRVGRTRRGDDRVQVGVGLAVGDVGAHGVVEQEGELRDDRDVARAGCASVRSRMSMPSIVMRPRVTS